VNALTGVGEYDTVLPEGIKGASSFGVSKGGSMTDQAVRHAQSIPVCCGEPGAVIVSLFG
jgi:hypothetical protein